VSLLAPGYYGSGLGTNIAGGMRAGLDALDAPRLSGESAKKVLVVLTDGHATSAEPPGSDPWNSIDHYANVARSRKVVLHAITLGDDAAGAALSDASALTGGTYHHVADGDLSTLLDLFQEIGRGMDQPSLVK
jgi:Mg-chelatase subunit ChlD